MLRANGQMRPLAWSRIAAGALFLFRTTPLIDLLRLPFVTDTWPLLGWPSEHWAGPAWFHLLMAIAAAACVLRTVAAALFAHGTSLVLRHETPRSVRDHASQGASCL